MALTRVHNGNNRVNNTINYNACKMARMPNNIFHLHSAKQVLLLCTIQICLKLLLKVLELMQLKCIEADLSLVPMEYAVAELLPSRQLWLFLLNVP